jgi:phosphate transport system substrate-binding protein
MKKLFLVALVSIALIVPQAVFAGKELDYWGSSTIGMSIFQHGATDAFEKESGIKVNIENCGSGKGINALLGGKADFAGASRKLKAKEKKKVLGTAIGYDAIAVFVHKSNPVENLTKAQLKGIFTGKITNWKEVGGNDEPITANTEIQGEGRATMLVFQKIAMDKAPYGKGFKEIDLPRDQIVHLAKDPTGICTVSFGLLAATSEDVRRNVKAIKVNGKDPSDKNIRSGAYLISRPLLLVTKGLPKGDVKTFVDFMLSKKGQGFVAENFVPVRR